MSELDGWKHCPRCAAELRREEGRAECESCASVYYAGSKVTASALVIDDQGLVLLSRRGAEPYKDQWDFPGGFLEEGEHPLDGLKRELREEADIEIDPNSFLGVWMDRYGEGQGAVATLNFYWTVRVAQGNPEPADDVAEFRWFAPEAALRADLAFRHLREVLSAWRDEHT